MWFGEYEYLEKKCPSCKSHDLALGTVFGTIVGYTPNKDENHYHQKAVCKNCDLDFAIHWVPAHENSWVVQNQCVLAGEASCCKRSYKIHCCDCGQWRIHSSYLLKGPSSWVRVNDEMVPSKPQYWYCPTCDRKYADHTYGWKYAEIKYDHQ